MKNALRRKETSESLAQSIHPALLTEHLSLPVNEEHLPGLPQSWTWKSACPQTPPQDPPVCSPPAPGQAFSSSGLPTRQDAAVCTSPGNTFPGEDQDSSSWVVWPDIFLLCSEEALEKKAGPGGHTLLKAQSYTFMLAAWSQPVQNRTSLSICPLPGWAPCSWCVPSTASSTETPPPAAEQIPIAHIKQEFLNFLPPASFNSPFSSSTFLKYSAMPGDSELCRNVDPFSFTALHCRLSPVRAEIPHSSTWSAKHQHSSNYTAEGLSEKTNNKGRLWPVRSGAPDKDWQQEAVKPVTRHSISAVTMESHSPCFQSWLATRHY